MCQGMGWSKPQEFGFSSLWMMFAGRSRTSLVKVAVPTVPPQDTALLALTSSALVIIVLVLLALSIIYCKRFWKSQCQRGELVLSFLLCHSPVPVAPSCCVEHCCFHSTVTQLFPSSYRTDTSSCFSCLQDFSCVLRSLPPSQGHQEEGAISHSALAILPPEFFLIGWLLALE